MAGDVVVKGKAETTIRARVFSGPNGTGKLLADLGVIVGKRTKEEEIQTNKQLKMLEGRSKAKRKEESE